MTNDLLLTQPSCVWLHHARQEGDAFLDSEGSSYSGDGSRTRSKLAGRHRAAECNWGRWIYTRRTMSSCQAYTAACVRSARCNLLKMDFRSYYLIYLSAPRRAPYDTAAVASPLTIRPRENTTDHPDRYGPGASISGTCFVVSAAARSNPITTSPR